MNAYKSVFLSKRESWQGRDKRASKDPENVSPTILLQGILFDDAAVDAEILINRAHHRRRRTAFSRP
jgi:hypothetical protein